ncbi:MAG TPA: hypothetical protein VGW40_08395 [Allosphingosinicella sp.]|nr:hypothetical protein [Allosphingosinicella sp.]
MVLIALALAALQPAMPAQPMEILIERDPITDRLRATATLRGEGERIEIRCQAPDWGDVSVRYHSRRWLARGQFLTGQQPVTYRFDEQRPVRKLWHVRARTASFDDRGRTIAFLRALMGARRLVLRARDIENHRFDTVFSIGESSAAITQLLQTCGSSRINPRVLPQP